MALYILAYGWIEHRRNRKGPWEVTFTNSSAGPTMIINQAWLRITNVSLVFARNSLSLPTSVVSNQTGKIEFRAPKQTPFDVPFGKCIFEDLTFLPGTVTLKLFDHEVELLPRVLIVDHKELEWKSDIVINIPQQK